MAAARPPGRRLCFVTCCAVMVQETVSYREAAPRCRAAYDALPDDTRKDIAELAARRGAQKRSEPEVEPVPATLSPNRRRGYGFDGGGPADGVLKFSL